MRKQNKHKILVADESLTIQKLVHLTFSSHDFEVIPCSDTQEALSRIRNLKPFMALIDLEFQASGDKSPLFDEISKEGAVETQFVLLKKRDAKWKGALPEGTAVLEKPFDSHRLMQLYLELQQKLNGAGFEAKTDKVHESEFETLKQKKIGERLKAAVSEVEESKAADSNPWSREEQTAKITPDDFRYPVAPLEVRLPTTSSSVEETKTETVRARFNEIEAKSVVEAEVKKWIEARLPEFVEKLLKEEISKINLKS